MPNVFQFPTPQKIPTRMTLQQLNKYTCTAIADGTDPQTTICIHGGTALEIIPVTGCELANGAYSDDSESSVLVLKTEVDYAAEDQGREPEDSQSLDLKLFNKQLVRAITTLGVTKAVSCMAKAMLDAAHDSDKDFRVESKRGIVTIDRPDPFIQHQDPSDVEESWSDEFRRFDFFMFITGFLGLVCGLVLNSNGFTMAYRIVFWVSIFFFVCSAIYSVVKRAENLGCFPYSVGFACGALAIMLLTQAS